MEKIIDKVITKGDQDITYIELFKNNKNKNLKIEIKSDAFKCQCFAVIKVFSETNGWIELYKIPYQVMETPNDLCNKKDGADEKYFNKDIQTLKRIANEFYTILLG